MSKLLCLLAITAISFLAVKVDGESRIIGGKNAKNGQFPHHAQIRYTKFSRTHCGGSIIGDRFVLTTAVCVPKDYPTSNLKVIVGEVDLQANGVEHLVDGVIIHPEASFILNNIAVVCVKQPFKFTANVRAIQLPTKDTPVTNDGSAVPATIVGWGKSKEDSSANQFSRILQWGRTTAISHPECERLLGFDTGVELSDNHICATDAKGTEACGHDEGGGLITQDAKPVLIGVLSFITNSCVYEKPNVYSRVFPHLEFIRSAMKQ